MLKFNNHHNVYILGAGFSAARGLPLIKDFMLALRDAHPWLLEHGRSPEAKAVEHVLQYRLDSAPASYRVEIDLENIEELFSLSDTGRDILSNDIRVAIAATLDYKAAFSPEPMTTFNVTDKTHIPSSWNAHTGDGTNYSVPMYRFFVQALLGAWTDFQSTSAFVTFNYDCLVDDALQSLGHRVDYGIPKAGSADLEAKVSLRRAEHSLVKVLKLHGSVNWMRRSRAAALQILGGYADVMDKKGIPEIVPPTWRKLFAKELVAVWKAALGEIEQATRIVIMGFSMPETDLHFKYLLASGLRRNVALREIVFVDPVREAIAARARQLFGDLDRRPPVRIIESRVTRFINGGTLPETVFSIDRGIPQVIAGLQHSVF